MTLAFFATIERYYARTLPIICDISRTNGWIRTILFLNDQNFISDPVIAKYLVQLQYLTPPNFLYDGQNRNMDRYRTR